MAAEMVTLWIGLALIAAGGVLALGALRRGRPRAAAPAPVNAPETDAHFLFRGEILVDHDAGMLPECEADPPAWQDFRDWLTPRFADLPDRLDDLAEADVALRFPAGDGDGACLTAQRNDDTTHVTLHDPGHPCPATRHATLAEHAKVARLRNALDTAPHPVWKTAPDGAVTWCNDAARTILGDDALSDHVTMPAPGETAQTRFDLGGDDGRPPRWIEVQSRADAGGAIHHGMDVTKIVRAETVQRDFIQTLTKTFGYLTIGLAVFDKNRQLQLFNPALVDLTSLSAEFLSARPALTSFFDNLRDRQVMPEPRNYASWRAQITDMITSAEGGLYQETWTLPNDVTYRVTGRPHPDGAVAFLFEDITAEVMVARRYRTQLDLRQSALDNLREAVMIIGPNGVLALCNTACTDLLKIDPDSSFADMEIADLMRACRDALPEGGLWADVESALRQRTLTEPLRETIPAGDGARLEYRVEPLPGGARMLILALTPEVTPLPTAAE